MTEQLQSAIHQLSQVLLGKEHQIRLAIACLLAKGHLLLEDLPGMGKTTLAEAMARCFGLHFHRVHFTSDLLPADLTGVAVLDSVSSQFQFQPGPMFCEVLLADEINRASPRTQSALLEAMGESQVSVEGERFVMDELFFVIATQNPVEFHGTYPLPEAQMDRFAMRFKLGYVSAEDEMEILSSQQHSHPLETLKPCISLEDVRTIRTAASNIRITEELKRYIIDVVAATRNHAGIQMGASPRASITLMKCARALALINGSEYVSPDLIQELAKPVIAHRLALDPDAEFSGRSSDQIVQEILEEIEVPV